MEVHKSITKMHEFIHIFPAPVRPEALQQALGIGVLEEETP